MEQVFLNIIVPMCLHTLDPRIRKIFRCLSKSICAHIDTHHKFGTLVLFPNEALLNRDSKFKILSARRAVIWNAILTAPFYVKPQLIYIKKRERGFGITFILGQLFYILRNAGCSVAMVSSCKWNMRKNPFINETFGPTITYEKGNGNGNFLLLDHKDKTDLSDDLHNGTHVILIETGEEITHKWMLKNATLII